MSPRLSGGAELRVDSTMLSESSSEPRMYTVYDFDAGRAQSLSLRRSGLDEENESEHEEYDSSPSANRIRISFRVTRSVAGRWRFSLKSDL